MKNFIKKIDFKNRALSIFLLLAIVFSVVTVVMATQANPGHDLSTIGGATVGGILYGSATDVVSSLADVATGSVLVSGGIGIAPLWSTAPTMAVTNVTGTIPTAVLGNSSLFIGTTSVALNRASAALTLAGITLTTPVLGAATATSINGNALTAGTYTLTGGAGKTLTFNNSITLTGTDATTMTFPTTTATIARTDAANTFTGIQTFSTPIATGSVATMSATVGGGVPTPPNNTTTFLRGDGTFAAPSGGSGDMVLASVQSVTGLKTFDTTKLAVKGSSSGTTAIASANGSATNYTLTLPAANGTVDVVTTLTSSGTVSDAVIATYTAITGIAFTPAANTNYLMTCYIIYTSTAATTGINFAWDVPASVTGIHMTGYTTTTALGANEGFIQRADNVGTPTTAAIITTEQVAYLEARLRNGANATSTTLGFTPETANSVSVLVGSTCQYSIY